MVNLLEKVCPSAESRMWVTEDDMVDVDKFMKKSFFFDSADLDCGVGLWSYGRQ